jgi:hypothetical protein
VDLKVAGGGSGVTDLSLPDPLPSLTGALAEALTRLQATTAVDRDRLIGLVQDALVQLRATAALPVWHQSAAPISTAGTAWLHDLLDSVTVIAGWAQTLDPAGNPARLAGAVEAIDRNARRLLDLLGQAPV